MPMEPLLCDQYTAELICALSEAGLSLDEYRAYLAAVHSDYGMEVN